jgi:Bifunctional DNA primase/polymerase, N-terminal
MQAYIDEILNSLSIRDAFLYYRDKLGWNVHPCDPPGSKGPCPGKKPSVQRWWDYDPHDCNLDYFFGSNGHSHNIGLSPRSGLVAVDLDSKADHGKSVRSFVEGHPELLKTPRHVTNGGLHLMFSCRDLPSFSKPDGRPLYEPIKAQLSEAVQAELFHSTHSNLILPPSIHPHGTKYLWESYGIIEEITWEWLHKMFGFRPPEQKQRGRPHKELPWHLQFRGDLRSLDIVAMLDALGHPPTFINAEEEKFAILCPWIRSTPTTKKVQTIPLRSFGNTPAKLGRVLSASTLIAPNAACRTSLNGRTHGSPA